MFKYGKKSLYCFPLQLYMGLIIRKHGEKTPMQTYGFLFRTGLRKTEHTHLMFGANNKMINCARKKKTKNKQICMYFDTVLEENSKLREQDVAHQNQWKDEYLFYCFPFQKM